MRGVSNQLFFSKGVLALVLSLSLFTKPVLCYELDNFDASSSSTYDALFSLIQFSAQMAQVLPPEKPIKVRGEYGALPLPTAKITPGDFSKQALQKQKLGDMGGSPFGSTFGKSTFGKTGSDSTLQGLTAEKIPVPIAPYFDEELPFLENPEEMTKEQLIELDRELDDLQKEMNKIAEKETPYEKEDYKAYEKAKDLFKKNDKYISRLNEFDPKFVDHAKELFVKHSWRDMDKVGKRPYEKFIDRQESKTVFPYPKEQEPKPAIHQGEISH